MAVKMVTTIQRWIGLSTDDKPTPDLVGSTFYETNTGQAWVWNGSNWVEDIALTVALIAALREV